MRILLTGSSGLFAPYLFREAKRYGQVISSSRNSGDLPADLASADSVKKLIEDSEPNWVIHTAARTNVDDCERRPALAYRDNVLPVANLVKNLSTDVHLLYLSTDQVYPARHGPHKEDDVGPMNIYGKSKLAGENKALCHQKVTIVRTNFFGPSLSNNRQSLDDFVINSLRHGKEITLFSDVLFSPLHMTTLASLSLQLFKKSIMGIFNLGSNCGFSKAEFGLMIAKRLSIQTKTAIVAPSSTILSRAPRPTDLRVDPRKIEQRLRVRMPTLVEEIAKLA